MTGRAFSDEAAKTNRKNKLMSLIGHAMLRIIPFLCDKANELLDVNDDMTNFCILH